MNQASVIYSKGQYINGLWIKGRGKVLHSINPSYGIPLWMGNHANDNEMESAFQSAQEALSFWSELSFEERAHYTKKFAEQVEKNRDQLALLISRETGKPLWESYTEVTAVTGKINLSIQACHERTWPKETSTAEATAHLRFKPQGVVVVLGAFNFPAHLSNGHIVPALLAGNTVLYKPSEQAPAVAEFLVQCWHDSGLPPGVLNCLQGDAGCGNFLLSQDIQGVYFTGSFPTGQRIHQQFGDRPNVILALEMGGNNPLVVDEITNIQAAVYHSILSTLITSGQRCTCARRVIIPDTPMGDIYLQQLINAFSSVSISPFDNDPQPFMGPVICHDQALKHLQAQQRLQQSGGESLLSMKLLVENTGLISPGIMDMSAVNSPPDEEIFAPFIQVYRYQHFDEAIELANNTRYGLAAGLLSDNELRFKHFYQKIRAGLINWNRPTTGAASSLPFGGIGCSGNHRPSAYYAADYCSYPVASMEQPVLSIPDALLPGIHLESLS